MTAAPERLRLDKWLWQARFFKTRSLAARVVSDGRCRVNGTPVSRPATMVAQGDVLTFPQARVVRVIRVMALGERRGPAPEAQALFADLAPPEQASRAPSEASGWPGRPGWDGKGRPTKKDRRRIDSMRSDSID